MTAAQSGTRWASRSGLGVAIAAMMSFVALDIGLAGHIENAPWQASNFSPQVRLSSDRAHEWMRKTMAQGRITASSGPRVGTLAPPFLLRELYTGRSVGLLDYRDRKPVLLVFGSFSCDLFCSRIASLRKLHRAYGDRAEFLFVYSGEASHTIPEFDAELKRAGYAPSSNLSAETKLRIGLRFYDLTMPCLTGADNWLIGNYGAWPLRVVLVDRAGRVAWDGGEKFPAAPDYDEIEKRLITILAARPAAAG